MASEPPFICDDEQCAPGVCSLEGVVPTWMRPYRCQYLSEGDRRARDIVFADCPTCGAKAGEACRTLPTPGLPSIKVLRPHKARTGPRDPTYMTGDARTTTEHEVASPPDAGQPTVPTEPPDVQGEPAP